jgi:hypothetical protein
LYIEAPHFVERPWLTAQIAAALDDPTCRFLLLTAEPGAGKSSIMAWLADCHPDWPRYFIRADSRTPLNSGHARSFLFALGHQLAAYRPELFRLEQVQLAADQRIGDIRAGGTVVGISIEELRASPFSKTALTVQQDVQVVAGDLVGLSIKRMVADLRLLDLANLQELRSCTRHGCSWKPNPTRASWCWWTRWTNFRWSKGRRPF